MRLHVVLCLLLLAATSAPATAALTAQAVAERLVVLLHRVETSHHTGVRRAAEHARSLLRDLVLTSANLAGLVGRNDPDEWRAIRYFDSLHRRMAELDDAAGYMMAKLEWRLVPFDLTTYKHTMEKAHQLFMQLLRAEPEDRSSQQNLFAQMFEIGVRPALWRLYNALIDADLKGARNLANSTRILLRNDAMAITITYDVFLRHLARGIMIDAAHSALNGSSDPNSSVRLWFERFESILQMADTLDKNVHDAWATQYPKDVNKFMSEHKYLTNSLLATQLQSYLSALYEHRLWFVLVFSGDEGVVKRHYSDSCGGVFFFDQDSRKAVAVTSLSKSDGGPKVQPEFYFHGFKPSRWGFYFPFEKIAKKMFEKLGYSCNTYRLQSVVESKANPVLIGPKRHLARKEVLITRYFASNKLFTLFAVV